MDKDVETQLKRIMNEDLQNIHQEIHEKEFSIPHRPKSFWEWLGWRLRRSPGDVYHGLSRKQVRNLVDFPFASPDLVRFMDPLSVSPQAPVVTLFEMMRCAMAEKGLRGTAKGNLPRNFCRESFEKYLDQWPNRVGPLRITINKEEDFWDLHIARILAVGGGWMELRSGKFFLSCKGMDVLDDLGWAGLYPLLLHDFIHDFDWSCMDGYGDIASVQSCAVFTLYLLCTYGDTWRSKRFYEDCFLKAFPKALLEVRPLQYMSKEAHLKQCYSWRSLARFGEFFCLVERQIEQDCLLQDRYDVRKLPLLDEVVRFHAGEPLP